MTNQNSTTRQIATGVSQDVSLVENVLHLMLQQSRQVEQVWRLKKSPRQRAAVSEQA